LLTGGEHDVPQKMKVLDPSPSRYPGLASIPGASTSIGEQVVVDESLRRLQRGDIQVDATGRFARFASGCVEHVVDSDR